MYKVLTKLNFRKIHLSHLKVENNEVIELFSQYKLEVLVVSCI